MIPTTKPFTLILSLFLLITVGSREAPGANVIAWGEGGFNGLTNVPVGLTNVVGIASGGFHSLALRSDGTVVTWGNTNWGQFSMPGGLSNVVAIAAGDRHNLALKNDGAVVAWGYDDDYPTIVPPDLTNVMAIACGQDHSLALKSDGTVAVWGGIQTFGDLGATNIPVGLSNVVAIATGGAHHCVVLRDDSTVVAWGDNNAGSVTGEPTTVYPYYAAGQVTLNGEPLSNIVAVSAGNHPSLALKNDGTVIGWPNDMIVPDGLTNAIVIASGPSINLAIKGDGTIVRWGWSPQPPPPGGRSNIVAISAGDGSSMALVDDNFPSDGSPFIFQHPMNRTLQTGESAIFVVNAVGAVPLAYQWRFNGTNIAGANSATLLLTNVPFTCAGSYQCFVSNTVGSVTSSAAILAFPQSELLFDTSFTQFTNGNFTLQLTGLSAHGNVVIHVSTNLVNWNPIYTNPPVLGVLQFVDSTAANSSARFYRAEEK